jgi:hypothetical protein
LIAALVSGRLVEMSPQRRLRLAQPGDCGLWNDCLE